MKRIIGGLTILGVVAALFFLPVKIPYVAYSVGKALPVQEWQLVQDQTGRFTSIVRDHKWGGVQQIDAFQFEQGDFSGLAIDISNETFLSAGDTVLKFYSIRQREEIQQIEAQLALYAAQLQSDVTGDKPSVVQEAENKLHFARQDLRLKEDFYRLKKKLRDEGLIADTEFQIAENDWRLAVIQVEIAAKYLENVSTGIKPEGVGITEAQLRGLRNRLDILRQKGAAFVVKAPFSGWIVRSALPEELLLLHRADEYVVQIPIKVEQLSYLTPEVEISVTDRQTNNVFRAHFHSLSPKVEVLDNRQVSVLNAIVRPDSTANRLSTGISTLCKVDFGEVTIREYLKRMFKFRFYF